MFNKIKERGNGKVQPRETKRKIRVLGALPQQVKETVRVWWRGEREREEEEEGRIWVCAGKLFEELLDVGLVRLKIWGFWIQESR